MNKVELEEIARVLMRTIAKAEGVLLTPEMWTGIYEQILSALTRVTENADELKKAIHDSGMGVLRESNGRVSVCYRPEVEEAHHKKTLEVIHENIDLGCEVKSLSDQLAVMKEQAENAEKEKAELLEALTKIWRNRADIWAGMREPAWSGEDVAKEIRQCIKEVHSRSSKKGPDVSAGNVSTQEDLEEQGAV